MKNEWEKFAKSDKYGAIYTQAKNHKEFWKSGLRNAVHILKDVDPSSQDKFLDVGCGIGRVARFIAKKGYDTYGVDISQEMINSARGLNSDISNLEFSVNNGKSLPYDSSKFDCVYSVLVFQHLPGDIMRTYLSEIERVLRPDGNFWLQVPRTPKLWRIHFPLVLISPSLHRKFSERRYEKTSKTRYFKKQEIREILSPYNLKIEKTRKILASPGHLWLCFTAKKFVDY